MIFAVSFSRRARPAVRKPSVSPIACSPIGLPAIISFSAAGCRTVREFIAIYRSQPHPDLDFLFIRCGAAGHSFIPEKLSKVPWKPSKITRFSALWGSPGGIEVLLKKYEQYPALQSEFEVMIVLGDVFSRALSDRIRTRICSHVVSVYGATETQTTASAPVHMIYDTPGAVGYVVPDVTVEIVSEFGALLPRGAEGLIRIRSPHTVDHYMGDPAASAQAFRDGCFYPGDIGALDGTNLLRIVGRADAVLNLGGDKVNPELVEAALAECEGVTECAVFGSPNELGIVTLWAAVVADSRADDDKLRAYCELKLPPQFMPAGFFRVDRLPRNEMGKIDRPNLPSLLSRRPS